MSDTRALRDKLEETQAELQRVRKHLDKLRAHHAREKQSLQQELEAARQEVATLRARLEQQQARVVPAPAQAPAGGAPPTLPRTPLEGSNRLLVAIARLPEPLERALPRLTRLAGLSEADVRLRLSAAAPSILTLLPAEQAELLRETLATEGFEAVTCAPSGGQTRDALRVRRFSLDARGLGLEGLAGERLGLPFEQLRLLVRGQRSVFTFEFKEEVDYDARGTRRGKQVKERREQKEAFLWLYSDSGCAAFTSETDFGGLGERRGLTRHASLQALAEELVQRAPRVVLDERLVRLPRLALPFVAEGRGHELLGELMWQAVRLRQRLG